MCNHFLIGQRVVDGLPTRVILLFIVREQTHVLSILRPEHFFKTNIAFAERVGTFNGFESIPVVVDR